MYESRAFGTAGIMTNVCPGAVWISISPISDIPRAADAIPSIEHGELAEGREEPRGQVEDEVHEPVRDNIVILEMHTEVRLPRVARRPVIPTKGGDRKA